MFGFYAFGCVSSLIGLFFHSFDIESIDQGFDSLSLYHVAVKLTIVEAEAELDENCLKNTS